MLRRELQALLSRKKLDAEEQDRVVSLLESLTIHDFSTQQPSQEKCFTQSKTGNRPKNKTLVVGPKVLDKNTQTRKFLATFKTKACASKSRHDWRKCSGYHRDTDKRRDPYTIFYSVDDCKNKTETAYHPLIYKTGICYAYTSMNGCQWGECCAKAHGNNQLRNVENIDFGDPTFLPPSSPRFTDYLRGNKQYSESGSSNSNQSSRSLPHTTSHATPFPWTQSPQNSAWKLCEREFVLSPLYAHFLKLDSQHDGISKVIEESGLLFATRATCEFSSSQCTVHLKGLETNLSSAEEEIKSRLKQYVDDYLYQETKRFQPRLITDMLEDETLRKTMHRLQRGENISTASKKTQPVRLWYEVNEVQSTVRVVLLPLNKNMSVTFFLLLSIWAEQKGYDEFTACLCCGEDFNMDEGVVCPEGHLICTVTCFAEWLDATRPTLGHQEGLPCSVCKSLVPTKQLANKISEDLFQKFQDASMDAKIDIRVAVLQRQFDVRLQQQVDSLLEQYAKQGGSELIVQTQAKRELKNAQDTLNLACPHCHTCYCEFDGCMALKCSTCTKHFCGWCHKGFDSSQGTHDHVRECDDNLSMAGSYYAEASEIRKGQNRYRSNKLRKFLQRFKKPVRNAIVIELSSELTDLGMDPNRFFMLDAVELELDP
eukprot:gb/GEZN01003976.1/.p1 GENE.gb/GEZN01003976.1/~~gb/GEZN01003976.1/.p1  ORF type:complete len:654 (-),score=47.22 gb/GEZN01003976.1/:58-2019(-)